MPIFFDSEHKVFKLDSPNTSYIFEVDRFGYLLHLYYGAKIPDTDLSYLSHTTPHPSFNPVKDPFGEFFSLDLARVEYSCNGCGDYRGSALTVRRDTGTDDTDLVYASHNITKGKPKIPGLPATYAEDGEADTLEVLTRDSVSGAEVTLIYTVFSKIDAITRSVKVHNASSKPFDIERVMSTCLDFHDARGMDFIHLYGAWARERAFERVPFMHGTQLVSSKRGSSSHAHNPFIALCSHDATEETGDAYGFNFVYSGNFTASAEMEAAGGARVLMGINPEGFTWHLEPGETFHAPEAVMVYSSNGLGGMSRTFHRLYNNNLIRPYWRNKKRPILINNWEGTYYDFDEEKLYEIAKAAGELGIEMLVMDDGWFGERRDETVSLGDWYVNENKLRGGLGKLTERINALGMKFGIWFEPEMVSKDSEMFRAHPDWTVRAPDRTMSIGRYQYVLDMSRPDVRDHLFNRISDILDNANIAYIKWDFNRNLTEVGSALLAADRQKEVFHRYVLGLYELMDRIFERYPELLLEGCSGGGGRFDPGMLYYSPQIWTSDDTDAMERLDIQYGTSMCYPTSSMGAHVSAVPNHQLGRVSPLTTRGDIAMAGTFGYELDMTKMTEEDRAEVRRQCEDYHKYYDLIHFGDLYRLISPWRDRTRCAWSYVSEDKREAIVTYVVIRGGVTERCYLRLAGLCPDTLYRIEQTGQVLSGAALMNAGICIKDSPIDMTSFVFHLTAV